MNERIVFVTHGALGIVDADTRRAEPRRLDFDVPDAHVWGHGPVFSDGSRIVLNSYDDPRTWEGTARSRAWIFDLDRPGDPMDALTEITTENPPSPFMPVAALLPCETRILANPMVDGHQCLVTMNLDGTDCEWITQPEDGFAYGAAVSPGGERVTWHAATESGYRVFVADIDGANRVQMPAELGHLYFGPTWSPDAEWIAYLDCDAAHDPGHDRADVIVAAPDGSEQFTAVWGGRHWMSATWGNADTHGNGSNVPRWSPNEHALIYSRLSDGARWPWVYQPERPDTNHFNRDFLPEQASGGTDLCAFNQDIGSTVPLTQSSSRDLWDFRAEWSPDGSRIAFCRALVGRPSELWVMDADGRNERALTLGLDYRGADHPRWIPGR